MLSRTLSTRFLLACMLALGVLLLLPPMASALVPKDGGPAPGTETRITTSPGDEYDPAISGNLIVYSSYRSTSTDVYYYNLATGLETQVTNAVGDQELSDVNNGRIVYTDLETLDVLLYDPATGSSTNLTPERPVSINPCISGDIVAWEDVDQGSQQVYARDIVTGELRQLSNNPDVNGKPATDGRTVVWEAGSNTTATCSVHAYDWASGTSRMLASNLDGDFRRPDVSGDKVVYDGMVNGERDIYCYDLATDTVRHLELPGVQIDTNVSGDYVCFEDLSSGMYHLGIWDLATDTVYWVHANDAAGQYLNDIDGHRLVYTDDRDGQLDIYMRTFDVRPPTLTVTSPVQGAVYTKYDTPVAQWSAVDDYSGVASSGDIASGQALPMTPGTHTVTFWATDGFGNRASIDRTYTVQNVGLSLFPAPGATLPFGDVTVGQAVTQIVTATNSGQAPLWISAATTSTTPAAFSVSGGGVLLNPGQAVDLAVRFAPTTTAVLSGALHVEGCDATSHAAYPLGLADIVLTGRGVSAELPPNQAAQKLLVDYNAAIANGTLWGSGSGVCAALRVKAMRCMIEATGDYIARGNKTMARILLNLVIDCCDGQPPDFVSGPARQPICDEAKALLKSIGG